MTLRFCLRWLQCSRLQDAGVALLLATSTIAAACARDQAAPVLAAPSRPRLVGYLSAPKGVNLADSIKTLDLSRMTDLNLAFGDPPKCDGTCTTQSDMAFSVKGQMDTDIDAVVPAAHAAGVKVFLSVGGGGALDDGEGFSYVGEDTMAQETQLGEQYGGIMIWQLLGDAPAPHSLLKVIEKNL